MAGKINIKALRRIYPIFEIVNKHITSHHSKLANQYARSGLAAFNPAQAQASMLDADRVNRLVAFNRTGYAQTRLHTSSGVPNQNNVHLNPSGGPDTRSPTTQGDPVSMVSGEEILSLVDGTLPGYFNFQWERTYRSSLSEDAGILGYGWCHSLAHGLVFQDNQVYWINDKSLTTVFPEPDADQPAINNLLSGASIALGDEKGSYQLIQDQGQGRYHFTRVGNYARLTAISDRFGNQVTLHYTKEGRLVRVNQDNRVSLYFDYHQSGLLSQVTSMAYQATSDNPQGEWCPVSILATYHYNERDQLVSVKNAAEQEERYTYRDDNVITQRLLAGGAEFNWDWAGNGKMARCIRQFGNFNQLDEHYIWSDDGQRVKAVLADGSEKHYQHNDKALLVYEKNTDGGEIFQTFDDDGNLILRTDAQGHQYHYSYNTDGQLEQSLFPDGTMVTYEYLFGYLRKVSKRVTSHHDQIWIYRRDDIGNITEMQEPDGLLTHYDYNAQGKVTRKSYPDGTVEQFTWDELGRLIQETSSQGTQRDYRYHGLQVNPTETVDESGHVTALEWNALGQLVKWAKPDGTSREYQYNAYGKVTRLQDEAGRITTYEYAAPLHLLTRKNLPDGNCLKYRYDNIHLQVSEIENQKGEVYRISYAPNGLISEEIGFDNIKTTYAYDLNGKLIEKREFGDQHESEPLITRYLRDEMGRLRTKVLPDGQDEQYEYDIYGRLSLLLEGEQALAWEYDIANRLTAEHQRWATLRHEYDPATGALIGTKLPDNQKIAYRYIDGQLRGMTLDGNPIAAFNYDNSGRVRERRQGNGLINRYQYDVLGRLSQHELREGFEDSPQTLWKQDYHYQADNELAHIVGTHARDYQYDAVGQLVAAGYPDINQDHRHADSVETFCYDAAGNRVSHEKSAKGNRLAFFGDRHFEYDRFGNLIAERRGTEHKLLTTYEYDCRHRLIKHVSPNGRVSTYTYDAFNRRTSKTVDGKKIEFVWQGSKLIAECSDKDTVWRSYLYEPGTFRPLALVEGNAKKNQKTRTYWYQNDHLGTPHSLTDSLGALVYSCTYNAYGQVQTETQHQQQERGLRVETNLRFQGQYADEETGLFYNLNRYYDPGLGRYLTQDPVGLPGGLNQYAYAYRNPVLNIDPLGLSPLDGSGFENTGRPDFYIGPDGPSATMPSTAYRYMDSQYAPQTMENMSAPLSYFGYKRYDTGHEARDAYQIFYEEGNPNSWSDARLLGEFDTLQLYKDGVPQVQVPLANGGKGPGYELFTNAYPEYGKGGALQLLPSTKGHLVFFDKVTILPE